MTKLRTVAIALLAAISIALILFQPWEDAPSEFPLVSRPEATSGTTLVEESSMSGAGSLRGSETSTIDTRAASPQSDASLWAELDRARRAVRELKPAQSAMPQNEGVRFFAANPYQKLTARFLDGRTRFESAKSGKAWSLELATRTNFTQPARPVRWGDHRVEIHHSQNGITEWYENIPDGFEHGFVLQSKPRASAPEGLACVRIGVGGTLTAEADPTSPGNLRFVDAAGRVILGYRNLRVWDDSGTALAANMRVDGGNIVITYNDGGASYPVTIDPLILNLEQEIAIEIPASPGVDGGAGFGFSLALDTAGGVKLAAIGAPGEKNAVLASVPGAVYVFSDTGSGWNFEARITSAEIAPIDSTGYVRNNFGDSLDLSNGTLVVGAPRVSAYYYINPTMLGSERLGGGYVFVRDAATGTWSEQDSLHPNLLIVNPAAGKAIAVSGDRVVMTSVNAIHFLSRNSSGEWGQTFQVDDLDADSVSIDGDLAIVGVPDEDTVAGSQAGAAYLYRYTSGSGWALEQRIVAGDGAAGDHFGRSVSASGDRVVVGAEGAAYVFDSGHSWTLDIKLVVPGGSSEFGYPVDIDGDNIVVGGDGGYAFSYRSGWIKAGTFSDLYPEGGGSPIVTSGDYVMIGAPDVGHTGGVGIFRRGPGTFGLETQIETSIPELGFGNSIDISGELAIVGAPTDATPAGNSAGTAFILEYAPAGWLLADRLEASDAAADELFGNAVAVDGAYAAVGSKRFNTPYEFTGKVYTFLKDKWGWQEEKRFLAPQGTSDERFGEVVALSDDTLAVGASGSRYAPSKLGSVYFYRRSRSFPDWLLEQRIDGAQGSGLVGNQVALDQNRAVIGFGGGADVYERDKSDWDAVAVLMINHGIEAVALSGDVIAISFEAFDSTIQGVAGMVSLFQLSGGNWLFQKRATVDNPREGFGRSLDLSGDLLVVGDPGPRNNLDPTISGTAHLFIRASGSWSQVGGLADPESPYYFLPSVVPGSLPYGAFGSAVAISGSHVLVGAPERSSAGNQLNNWGSVFAYDIEVSRSILLNPKAIDENLPLGSIVGQLALSDSSSGEPYSFVSGVGDVDNAFFGIAGDQLITGVSFDADLVPVRHVRIRSADALEETFAIEVIDDRTEDADFDGLTEADEEDIYGTSDTDPDYDNDDILDGAEIAAGLDPFTADTQLAAAIQAYPQAFGIESGSIGMGATIIARDPVTGELTLGLRLRESDNLQNFTPMILDSSSVEVQPDGSLQVTVPGSGTKVFYIIEGE